MKLALITFCIFLVIVPSLAYRIRTWNNAKCSGGESSYTIYSNKKDLCQPYLGGGFFKAKSDCKNGQSASIQFYTDGKCDTTVGDLVDSGVVNNGDCISDRINFSSYIIDCSNGNMAIPSFAFVLAALLALFLL